MTRISPWRWRQVLGNIAMNFLALCGALCILLVIAAVVFNVSIVMFATGSMSPTIPTGSIAFVQKVPATTIKVGDVVTVDRKPELPVTHRVVEIVAVDGDEVTFRLQGDANSYPDSLTYTRSTVAVVLWSIPGLAAVIVWFDSPFVLGSIALGASVLVTWAFWPRRQREAPEGRDPEEHETLDALEAGSAVRGPV